MSTTTPAPSPDTPITIKVALSNGENRRFKLPLRELGANTLPDKVCFTHCYPALSSETFHHALTARATSNTVRYLVCQYDAKFWPLASINARYPPKSDSDF